jgi:hypothetical protein
MSELPSVVADAPASLKPYMAPQLTHYGQVSELTQSGSGTSAEGPSCPYTGPGQPSKKPCTSDRRLKRNIQRIGTHPLGFGLYLFEYARELGQAGRRFGVMADEVARAMPEAVVERQDGYLAVRYDRIGVTCAAGSTPTC